MSSTAPQRPHMRLIHQHAGTLLGIKGNNMNGGSWNIKSLIQYTYTEPSKSMDLNPSVTTAISKTEIHLARSKLPLWTALQSSIGELEAMKHTI